MNTIEEMEAEVSKVVNKANYNDLILIMESKLALIQHSLLNGTDQLGDPELTAISYLINEMQEDFAQIKELCEEVTDYFSHLNNPESLADWSRAEKIITEGRH